MMHEEVLKSFYASLKGVHAHAMIRVLDLAKEHNMSYRYLSGLLRTKGVAPCWIGGKAFIARHEASDVLYAS